MCCHCCKEEASKPTPFPQPERPSAAGPLTGILLNAANGFPLADLAVRAHAFRKPDVRGTRSSPGLLPEVLLGEAISGADGRFVVDWLKTPEAQQALCVMSSCGEMDVTLDVFNAAGVRYAYTAPDDSGAGSFVRHLHVTLTSPPVSAEQWSLLARRMEDSGVTQLHGLVRGLVLVPAAQSLLPEESLETRHAMVDALSAAFLDPKSLLKAIGPVPTWYSLMGPGALTAYQSSLEGDLESPHLQNAFAKLNAKVETFASLAQVDWVIDTQLLGQSDLGGALQKFENVYTVVDNLSANAVPAVVDENLVAYRDYLRTIFTDAPGSPSYDVYKQQLQDRFHQSFTTKNSTKVVANTIINNILKEILTAPAGATYGFGLQANAIEAQGQRTPAQYRDYLISLTNLYPTELALRYRLDLDLPDSVLSSRVEQNIHTLQSFYKDGFQSQADPSPIIPSDLLGVTPFFLQYEEWLQLNGPFFPENYYQIRETVESGFNQETKDYVAVVADDSGTDGYVAWFHYLIRVEDLLAQGHGKLDLQQYKPATDFYLEAAKVAREGLQARIGKLGNMNLILDDSQQPKDIVSILADRFVKLKKMKVDTITDLEGPHYGWTTTHFMAFYRVGWWHQPGNYWKFLDEAKEDYPQHLHALLHAYLYVIPICLGDVAMAAGDFAKAESYYGLATGFQVGKAYLREGAGFPEYDSYGIKGAAGTHQITATSSLFFKGPLPYSADLSKDGVYLYVYPTSFHGELADLVIPEKTHPMEKRFCRLRHGGALLEWADALYRAGDDASVQRARELYKAVLWLHGRKPPISPQWDKISVPVLSFHKKNPALTSQLMRAQAGLYQIDEGLNYFGATDAYVPSLRYRPLKDAADRFAASAKAAEGDFILAVSKIEEAVREGILTANMLKKARLQASIASEQVALAEFGVTLAQRQVKQIEAAIKAKEEEMAEHDGLGEQLIDWVKGFVDVVDSLPSGLTEGLSFNSVSAGAGLTTLSSAQGGMFGGGGWLGLGAGASAAGAYGLFVYAGVTSLVNMGDAQNQRAGDLSTLRNQALPMAQAQKAAKEREVTIAELQRQIAEADAELAHALLSFQVTRTLSTEFWANVAAVLKRVLRRYLELGARHAWLAERSLAYEQDRPIDIIRFDYFPAKLYGATGADLLQLDLAELEAARLSGIRQSVPVKHTFSLAFDFPLQFTQLKKTGRCTIRTPESVFRNAHPGVYGYRIRALSIAAQTATPVGALRGILSNFGVSLLSRRDGTTHVSARYPDALPLSEFKIEKDLVVFQPPQETLLSFEGSGVETFWELELPKAANPQGLEALADVLIAFDLTASYSAELHETDTANPVTAVRRSLLASMHSQAAAAFQDLQGNAVQVSIPFDFNQVLLPGSAADWTIQNLLLAVVGGPPIQLEATLATAGSSVQFDFVDSVAASNAPPLADSQPPQPPAPLNAFAGKPLSDVFTLSIDKAANPGIDFSKVTDIVIGVDAMVDLQ